MSNLKEGQRVKWNSKVHGVRPAVVVSVSPNGKAVRLRLTGKLPKDLINPDVFASRLQVIEK